MTAEIRSLDGENDAARAKRYKDDLSKALQVACTVMTAAKRDGIILSFQLNMDGMGVSHIAALGASKEL